MADLVTSWEGWDYYDNGTAISPTGAYYFEGQEVWSPSSVAGGGSLSSWESMLGAWGTTAVDTWAKTQLMQKAQDGRRYIEGQRIAQQQMQTGGIPPLFLLIGAGVLFVMMAKG